MKKEIVSEETEKSGFDEETLGRLLEAAYVLQEHSRRAREGSAPQSEASAPEHPILKGSSSDSPGRSEPAFHAVQSAGSTALGAVPTEASAATPKDDYTLTLAQIVEVQHQIQVRRLGLNQVMALVAERVAEIARAAGASIGILKDETVAYRAVHGSMTLPKETTVPIEGALCAASLRTGQVIRCANLNAEFLVDTEECRRRGIQSLIIVPVYHEGGVAGALELYYSATHAFSEQDVHTCQLMAGLITEALARAEEQTWKQSLADERAAMMEALEKLKPNLAALVEAAGPLSQPAAAREAKTAEIIADDRFLPEISTAETKLPSPAIVCHKCGNELVGEEQFCGKCGLPRSGDYEPPSMQSKVASLWHMQEEAERQKHQPAVESTEEDIDEQAIKEILTAKNLPGIVVENEAQIATMSDEQGPEQSKSDIGPTGANETSPAEESSTDPKESGHWSSAASARDFLEQLATRPGAVGRFWNARRGDIYLAIAVVLVIGVIRWGIWSNHSVGASGTQPPRATEAKPASDSTLSMFDRMLISLGLAETPEPPESKGNPQVQVWVDLQTALYYCPGADLYGKTPKGKFSSQREAQLDQFEPALRQACN